MIMFFYHFVAMAVSGFVSTVNVCMGMGMLVGMGMEEIAMPVDMIMAMGMGMRMLQRYGILDHQHRCHDHDGQSNKEADIRTLTQQYHAKQDAKKGCDGVISACFRRAQIFLSLDIEIDA